MLLPRPILDALREGRISLMFRKCRRLTVKGGGRLKTAVGVLAIESIEQTSAPAISEADAKRAGYASRAALLLELDRHSEGSIYRIAVGFAGADPRIALRQAATLAAEEWSAIKAKLRRMDGRTKDGPWTRATLDILRDVPPPGHSPQHGSSEAVAPVTYTIRCRARAPRSMAAATSLPICSS